MFFNERLSTRHSCVGENPALKAGVSLVTVLLFMLVATIAATATYKWLTSEGRSSASRMQQQEAYQSAVAGIESARSWMMYNANETGAIIKQYKDGNNAPVKLTDRLAAFVRAGQHYDVYLVGVNTESSTYKLKILSEGASRNGNAKHSEIALLNVNGLYQVKVPVEESHSKIKFDFNYFGGSTQAQGHVGAKSMLINGNLTGSNPVYAQTDLIVTGNIEMSGNSVGANGTVCVGGNLEASNGVFGNSFYVEGDARQFSWPSASEAKNTYDGTSVDKFTLTGDVYINGNLEAPSTGGQIFPKDLTLNGTWSTNFPGYESSVTGSLCLGDTGFIYINKFEGKTFSVGQDVWMPGNATMPGNISFWKGDMSGANCTCNRYVKTCKKEIPWFYGTRCLEYGWDLSETGLSCTGNSSTANTKNVVQNCDGEMTLAASDDNFAEYERLFLGQQTDSKVYIKRAHTLAEYKTMREDTKATTTGSQIQHCRDNDCNPPAAGNYWKNETLYPYMDKNKPVGKPNPNYIYYMPNSVGDVEYSSYYDDFWKQTMYAFFVNFPTSQKDAGTTYTSSYHSQDEGAHPNNAEGGYYRFLNTNSDGSKIKGSPYCKKKPGKSFTPECGVAPWFGSNGTVTSTFPTEKPFPCADTVKTYCLEKLGDKKTGCDGASYKVDDLLKTAYSSFEKYANKGCADVTTWSSDMSSKLNTCYTNNTATEELAKENLYNGYQVVKVTDNGKSDPNTELKGKFIIIVTNAMGQQSLPPTTADSYVFLYMLEGGSSTIQPADEGKGHKYNYFIYTEQSVVSGGGADAGFMFNNDVLSGSIYAKAENCANVQNFKARKMEYNEELLKDLQDSSILCDYDASTCGGAPATSSSSGTIESSADYATGGYDNFYISVAPQLSITLESQYKNAENVATANAADVDGSFIVLPRIIYLPKDAKGKLADYYNIVSLNTANPVTSPSVTCNGGLPASGKLVSGDSKLAEGDYTCKVVGSIQTKSGAAQQTVPFWVRVRGEGGSLPIVSFGETWKELSKGNSTPVTLSLPGTSGGGTQSCQVKISVTGDIMDWTVDPVTSAGVTSAGSNVYSATVTSGAPITVFNVTNTNSENGSIYLTVTEGDACSPGAPEVLYNANMAPIERQSIAQYCIDYSTDPACAVGGTYDNKKNNPDCSTPYEWVTANGVACSASEPNEKWRCAISGAVSLKKLHDIAGCEVLIAPLTHTAPLEANKEPPYHLYASLKKIPMTFHAGFSVEGSIDGDRKVKIEVEDASGDSEKECSYSDFQDDSRRAEKCDVKVYDGSIVKLSLIPEDPADFNYWACESGLDCPDDEAHTSLTYQISITSDENVVYAHFGENDKHCFFDEFKEPTRGSGYRHNRDNIWCGYGTDYCIDYCEADGNSCASNLTTSSYPNAKWRLMSTSTANTNDIDYSVVDARIALKSSATRGKKESDKKFAVVMSSVQAGLYGTLKAQFQLPREGVNASDIAKSTARYSGFVLRSNPTVTSFLLLNVYIASDGKVHSRLCLDGETTCKDLILERNGASYSPTDRKSVVLVAATLGTSSGNDVLKVELYSSAWTNEAYSATFTLTDSELSGVTATATRPNEYVGYILSDQNFKIYGIGWKSDSYRSECWDTYPVLSCSFKAAYPTGIVPKDKPVQPWVGFSAWFDAVAGGCREGDVGYYYKGDDACSGTGSTYNNCGGSYSFSAAGAHGYMEGENEVRMAKVDVATSCNVYGEDASWARNGIAANCGSFWVGEMNACTRHHSFEKTLDGAGGEFFGLEAGVVANLRGANLKINLDNPDGKAIEIYMFSQNNASGYTYGGSHLYSLPYQTNRSGTGITLDLPVNDLLNSEGFDPENVIGVYVKTFDEPSVTVNAVTSSCPNAVEIKGCRADYDNTNGKWVVTAEIKNSGNMERIDVVETNSYITSPSSRECEKESTDDDKKCKFSGDNVVLDWNDNPYVNHAGDTYNFKITLTSKENTTSECTATGKVDGITATCSAISGSGTVVQGKNLPQLTYSIANCPDNACGFKIDLYKDGSFVKNITTNANSGNVSGAQTSTTAANTSAEPLDEGTYKFVLTSTNTARPFTATGCDGLSFEVTTPGAITANCVFTGTVVKGGSATLQMTNIVNVDQSTDITISRSGATGTQTATLTSNDDKNISVTAPDAADTYTYTINYTDPISSATKKICDATLTVVDGLACGVSTATITLGETFTFTPSYGGSCSSASLTGNGTITGSGCSATSFTVEPSSVGSQEYTYTFSGDIGSNLTCKQTVTVNPPAPEFSCPDNWRGAVGSNVTFNPGSSLKYCSSDYPCVLKIDGVTKSSSWTGPTYEWKDDAATTSTNKYTISLKNSYNDAATVHDCSITYSSGNANCVWENGATSFWPGQQNVKLIVSDIQNLASDAEFTLTCGTSSTKSTCRTGGSCDNLQFSVPSTVGTYACTLKNNTMTLCSPSLQVKAPLSCSVTSNTVDYGGKFKFTGKTATSSCHNCKLYRGNNEYQYTDNQSNIEDYEITFNWSEPKTFTYECQCDNMDASANKCSQTVASQVNPPTFDCKTGLKATIDKSNNVTIGLQNVVGCHEGGTWCKYSITGTGISEKTGTGISNGTVNLGAFTDNGTDGSTKNYSVNLENSAGVGEAQTCSVEFTAGSSAIPVTISYQDYKSFTPGNTYTLTFSGSSGSVFRCTYTDRAYSFKMGVYDGSDWNVGANTGGQATKSNPGNGAVKTFVVDSDAPSDLKCATDW
ncbi:hypothetical protein [Fibrobacter sp. UBA2449]|uniref:hypothetical protein n=1 Tax=Fibrobacter sp. UBA2449 TaxID=1946529 RepID=UPI0025BCE876|nr:hypothetical protein [Fibrobacter sp. UBA2449]